MYSFAEKKDYNIFNTYDLLVWITVHIVPQLLLRMLSLAGAVLGSTGSLIG